MTTYYRIGLPALEHNGSKLCVFCGWSAWTSGAEFPFAKGIVSTDYDSIEGPGMLRSLFDFAIERARYEACEALLKHMAPKPEGEPTP